MTYGNGSLARVRARARERARVRIQYEDMSIEYRCEICNEVITYIHTYTSRRARGRGSGRVRLYVCPNGHTEREPLTDDNANQQATQDDKAGLQTQKEAGEINGKEDGD